MTMRGQRLRVTALHLEMPDKTIYHVEKLTLSGAGKVNRKDLEESLRDALVNEFRGKLADETDAKLGAISGKDYTIETGKGLARVRLFVSAGGRVVILHVEGSKEQVEQKATTTFLDSCRLGREIPAGEAANRDRTRVVGGGADPEFSEEAPENGLLVGLEIGLGKFFNNDIVKSARPIFRVGDKDSPGKQVGTEWSQVVKAVAKPGYAVGAITVKAGLGVDGMSVTFMKVTDGLFGSRRTLTRATGWVARAAASRFAWGVTGPS